MTISRFFGLALRVMLLVLLVGFIGAWLTGTLRFNLGVGNWNVQLNSSASASCPPVTGANYLRTEGGREVWNVGGELRLMKPKKHPNACFQIVGGVAGWRNPPGF